jgi:choline-sulfatase
MRFWLAFTGFLVLLASCGGPKGGNVVLIIVDTLRSDHLGCYGYHRDTSPHIDSLAAEGLLFLNVTAGEPWTLPSMATIFTGLLPLEHNARRRGDSYYGLSPDAVTVTELLHRNGYTTAAFFNVIFMNADFGFHQGFDHFDCHNALGTSEDRDAGQTVEAIFSWLDTSYRGGPLFLAVHFYDPHLTYDPPEPYAGMWRDPSYTGEFDSSWGQRETVVEVNRGEITLEGEDLYNLIALYDGEIAWTDSQTGRLLAGLRERGITEDALVIVVADHGEEFLDHGKMGHAHTLYQELINVPMIISGPGFQRGSVCSVNASQADILPTILTWTGIETPDGVWGRDLLHAPRDTARTVFSGMNDADSYVVTARRGDMKLHLFDRGQVPFMFDLAGDPGEHGPLSHSDSLLLEAARFYLVTPPALQPAAVMVENVFIEALHNLGYI